METILQYDGQVWVDPTLKRVIFQGKPLQGEKLEAELIRRMKPGFSRVRIIIEEDEDAQ